MPCSAYEGFLGISFLAFVCAVTSANAALYMDIISPFGDKADKASFGIMLICSMPLLRCCSWASMARPVSVRRRSCRSSL